MEPEHRRGTFEGRRFAHIAFAQFAEGAQHGGLAIASIIRGGHSRGRSRYYLLGEF